MIYVILIRTDQVCNENTTLCKKMSFFAQLADDEMVEMVITRRRELHLDGAELTDDEGGENDGCEEKLHLDCGQLVGQLAHACLQL